MSLSNAAIRREKPTERPRKLADGFGLYMLINPNGSRWWRFRYRFQGKEQLLSLGTYPETTLALARKLRDEARKLLRTGVNPSQARMAAKLVARAQAVPNDTFEIVARQWMARQTVSEATADKNRWLFETFLFPRLGAISLPLISPRMLLDVLRGIEATGKQETARRAKIKAGQVFRFAQLEGLCDSDPTISLHRALKPTRTEHHAALTDPAHIGALLRAIDGYHGRKTTLYALKLAPLLFVRPGELRRAMWAEFDLEAELWRIPGERMKMKVPHIVPLASQTIELLRQLHALSGHGVYLFPSRQISRQHLGGNTLNGALRRLGYDKKEMTAHGFRSMAATRLNELGWNSDAIERQLSHTEPNKVRGAYTQTAQYLDERKRMMQAWADYLDSLRRERAPPDPVSTCHVLTEERIRSSPETGPPHSLAFHVDTPERRVKDISPGAPRSPSRIRRSI